MAWDTLIIQTPTHSVLHRFAASVCVFLHVQFCQSTSLVSKLQSEVIFEKLGHPDQS